MGAGSNYCMHFTHRWGKENGTVPPGQKPSLGRWSETCLPRAHSSREPYNLGGTAPAGRADRIRLYKGHQGVTAWKPVSAPLALGGYSCDLPLPVLVHLGPLYDVWWILFSVIVWPVLGLWENQHQKLVGTAGELPELQPWTACG